MKNISEDHFTKMEMMCGYFKIGAEKNAEYLPEFEAAEKINQLIREIENPVLRDFENIIWILDDVDTVRHKNDMHWYDYKLHVMATLRHNGFIT